MGLHESSLGNNWNPQSCDDLFWSASGGCGSIFYLLYLADLGNTLSKGVSGSSGVQAS